MVKLMSDMFRDQAPMTAAEASAEILDGVRNGRWRILVGDDARKLDEAVRAHPGDRLRVAHPRRPHLRQRRHPLLPRRLM